ncbi:MAG: DUF454 domain-containing protein [Lachnospiraceae bacterium]|jgi:uncharacterized membrane protein YbaN (DUF454 family)|nr:DUF454 domain-containing protein [Lachnospiraceae bacterium]
MKIKRLLYLMIGFICLGLGCIGIALPILPTVPFFLVTIFCFANSSQRLHDWFLHTKMYKKHLEAFVKKKGMTIKAKITVLISVSLLMGLGFVMMSHVLVGRIILIVIWICHIIYFIFGVKIIKQTDKEDTKQSFSLKRIQSEN